MSKISAKSISVGLMVFGLVAMSTALVVALTPTKEDEVAEAPQ